MFIQNFNKLSELRQYEGFLVKKRDGTVYEGNCWPGDSTYIDFINPDARKFWAGLFAFDKRYDFSTSKK
ncbi:hypothetical protein COOONC_27800 [Cooperia oncophora]